MILLHNIAAAPIEVKNNAVTIAFETLDYKIAMPSCQKQCKLSILSKNADSAMNRRTFLITTLSSSSLAIIGGLGWHLVPKNLEDLSISHTIDTLKQLDPAVVKFNSPWSVGHNLAHMAQSIEYSMQGYPVHKSDLFKSTVGRTAFNAFSSKGYMKHNLEEDIPGAPPLSDTDNLTGMRRLITALETFKDYEGELAEHFAYGKLTHQEYALAHVLHIKDHFSQQVIG